MTADSTTNTTSNASDLGDGDAESSLSHVPQMREETGYEEIEDVQPIRFSGFVCLFLGLLSAIALLGLPALVVPVLAILFGLFALRRSASGKPVGTKAARIGILLAIGFGFCGYFLPWMKTKTLGDQAKYYTQQYIGLIARGHDEAAMELGKEARNRFDETMPLDQFYKGGNEETRRAFDEFHNDSVNQAIREVGPKGQWVLDRPVEVYHKFHIDRAEIVWKSVDTGQRIHFFLQYLIDPDDVGQWHIERAQEYRELIVAESIL